MPDLSPFQSSSPETLDLERHAQAVVITDSSTEIHSLQDSAEGAVGSQNDFGSQLHKDLHIKETDVEARIAQLTAEIQQLSQEKPESSPEKQAAQGGIEGLRSYTQSVAGAIGHFFMALFGHAEPNLESHDPHIAETQQKINLDAVELKMLQQTRQAYQELDQRLAGLEKSATLEQQDAIQSRTEELQIREQTQQLLQSLLFSLQGDRQDSVGPSGQENSLVPDDPSRGDGSNLQPGDNALPYREVQPGDNVTPSQETAPENQSPNSAGDAGPPIQPFQAPLPENKPPFTPEPDTNAEPVKPTDAPQDSIQIIGDQDLEKDNEYVHPQGQNDYHDTGTCGVVTQEMILNRLTGTHDFTESGLTNEAAANGWFKPGEGSPLGQVGNLLEAHGYQVEHRVSSLEEMTEHLAKGEQVIVGVNAGKMGDAWASDPTAYGDGSVNHVVWISGARVETHNGVSQVVSVIVHDSGVGTSYELSAEQFKQAWEPSGNHAVYVSPTPGLKGAGA